MSGALKSGLIFGLIGILATAGVSLIFPLCTPVLAAVIGGAAGYFGVRWSVESAGVGTGVLAGGIAGAAMLIGTLLFFVVAFSIIRSDPQFMEMIQQMIAQQQSGQQLSPEQINAALSVAAPLAGLCFGVINLLAGLACGAIGGLIATRNRPSTYGAPPSPPPMAPLG